MPVYTKYFDTMEEAFDYCREVDSPVYMKTVDRDDETKWKRKYVYYKIFPSGTAIKEEK
jgi:hypothetical protein